MGAMPRTSKLDAIQEKGRAQIKMVHFTEGQSLFLTTGGKAVLSVPHDLALKTYLLTIPG